MSVFDWMWTEEWPGEPPIEYYIKQPWVMLFLLINYVYFVTRCGPKWMKNREPYSLRKVIIGYNTFQIFFNMYVAYFCYAKIVEQEGNLFNCIHSGAPTAKAHYLLMYSKYTDLIETFMFVLRKKQSQVSFLHVYHHCAVIVVPTIALYVDIGGMPIFFGVVNCTVHVIMYTYYLMTNLYPENRKLLDALKPRITEIQLIQFFILTIHFSRAYVGLCDTSKIISMFGISQNAVFCYLFSKFYANTYLKKKKAK